MEKQVPHYHLTAIKTRIMQDGILVFTATARQGASALGLSDLDAIGVVLNLQRAHFFKSMTTHADHRVWQDVYHAPCPNEKTAYIKLTMRDGALVIQFKEK